MAYASRSAAYDAIAGFVNTGWLASTFSAVPLHWPDQKDDTPPNRGSWVRVEYAVYRTIRATLRGKSGQRRFRDFGKLTLEIRTPLGDGLTDNQGIQDTLDGILEGQETGPEQAIFRDINPNSVGPDGVWFLTKYVVNFEYDRVH